MTENKIYLVTSGDYSDHQVDSAWPTREAAEAYCAFREAHEREPGEYARGWDVEEFPIRAAGELPTPHYQAYIETPGADEPWTSSLGLKWNDEYEQHPAMYHRHLRGYRASAVGRTEEAAKKAIYDLIAKKRAEQEGLI